MYTGGTEEEAEQYKKSRGNAYAVIDSIEELANLEESPEMWFEDGPSWVVETIEIAKVQRAIKWLERMEHELRGRHDAE